MYSNFLCLLYLLLEVVPVCQKPDDILNARYTVSMPVSRTIDSEQLHHNVVVIGGIIRNTTNITGSEETALMFLLGSVANYYCDDGYAMVGRSTLMCFPNGSWVGAIGGCESMCSPHAVLVLCVSCVLHGNNYLFETVHIWHLKIQVHVKKYLFYQKV